MQTEIERDIRESIRRCQISTILTMRSRINRRRMIVIRPRIQMKRPNDPKTTRRIPKPNSRL